MDASASPPARSERSMDQPSTPSTTTASSKRRKDDKGRVRVSRACDRCKRKKTRCTGRCPCPLCVRAGVECLFKADYRRGRLPSVEIDQEVLNSVAQRQVHFGQESMPSPESIETHAGDGSKRAVIAAASTSTSSRAADHNATNLHSAAPSCPASPETPETDLQGHVVGPSSGVSFLLRVQKRLHQTISFTQGSSIFTFGDAPLPEFDPSFFILPPKAEARGLVARYFDFCVPTHRFLHQPTVERWLDELYETMGTMSDAEDGPSRIALLFMVFAQAKAYPLPGVPTNEHDSSERYFLAAEHQLKKERGQVRLSSVQARLTQCFYLLSQSRINHCWSLFGTTTHLALAIGLNRSRRYEANGHDMIELECRRRVFWCAYSLDNYLSAGLGRPRTFKDEDIDQELPSVINDSDLFPSRAHVPVGRSQSVMLAAVAHVKLSRIVSLVLRDLYAIKPIPTATRISLASKYMKDLQGWRAARAQFLDADGIDPSLLLLLFQRQRNVLNLSYWHAVLLVQRPFLLSNFASLRNPGSARKARLNTKENVDECLNAAMQIVTIVDELIQGKQMYRTFWFTSYFAFCAVVVLYVYTIQQQSSPETYQHYFNAAAKCQAQISAISEEDSLTQRYTLVLEELRLEAMKQTETTSSMHAMPPSNHQGFHPLNHLESSSQNQYHINSTFDDRNLAMGLDGGADMGGLSGTSPNSIMADMTSWGQFDSLVTAGGWDVMLNEDGSLI